MNQKSLPARNETYTYDRLRATWLRIIEDRVVTSFEIVEMEEAIDGQCRFSRAISSSHAVTQAMPRATDPEYIETLVSTHQARMSVLPDSRDAA
jgi:hypothetical protein